MPGINSRVINGLFRKGLTHNTSGHFAHCATRKILQETFVKPPNKVS